MRVLLAPDFSGSNPYQRELRSHLEDRGVSVRFGTTSGRSLFDGVTAFPVLDSVWTGGRPDVFHLHWFHAFVADERWPVSVLLGLQLLFELLVLRLLGVRLVWTVHNLFDHERRMPRRLEVAFRHAVFRLCDRVIVHCDRAARAVRRTYRLPPGVDHTLTTIPHGHYVDSYPNDVGREEARSSLGFSDTETVFLFFGRIRAYKNVPGLVSAFGRLSDESARLLVVGTPRTDALAARVAECSASDARVRTTFEFVPGDEIQTFMNAADAVVLPFDAVLSSGSAILAMSFDRPVIVPGEGCVADLVPDELVYDGDRPDGLEAGLERALSADLDDLGSRCGRRARDLDWAQVARQTHEVYRSPGSTGG